jgi:hypothetical protein
MAAHELTPETDPPLLKPYRRHKNKNANSSRARPEPDPSPTREPGNRGARPVLPFFLLGSVILSTVKMIIKVINSKYIS